MDIVVNNKETVYRHLDGLTPELIQEVIDFIEFLKIKRMKRGNSAQGALLLQKKGLDRIWHNEFEDLYEL
jgi:hypothetical protein